MSQETERYQLENNGNSYLVRTTAGGGGGTDVEANPEGTATEDLTKLKVDDTIYGIPEGTEVVANPTLAGTESALTGLQVGDTKYAVPQGATIHTYAENTTYSGADYTQIKDDITNKRDMIISGRYYRYVETEATIYHKYISINYDSAGKYLSNYYLTITDNTSSMSVSSSSTITNYQDYNLTGDQARLLYAMQLGQWGYNFVGREVAFKTTAPTADNTSGYLDIRVLSSEPATRYNGYLYIITA